MATVGAMALGPGVLAGASAVARISPRETCVVAKIAPVAGANQLAREAADAASAKPCL